MKRNGVKPLRVRFRTDGGSGPWNFAVVSVAAKFQPSRIDAALIRELLIEIGEDPERQGLLKTPHPAPGVMIEAHHLCMMMRGIEKQNSVMVTSSAVGAFRESVATREELLSFIGSRGA